MIAIASAADLDGILALETHFDVAWSAPSWRAEIDGPGRLVLVVREEGEVVAAACVQVMDVNADLHRIVVAPEHRRRRLASELLRAGARWAAARGAGTLTLEVSHDNHAAIALYRGYGFTQVAVRRDYYGAGRDALLMQRGLSDVAVGPADAEAAEVNVP